MTSNIKKKSVNDDLNKIKPGNLIGLRSCNPITGAPIKDVYLHPFPSGAFETNLPIGHIKTNKVPVLYTSDARPLLFLGTNIMKPGTLFQTQRRIIFLHRVLLDETVYYVPLKRSLDLEEMFYVAQRGEAKTNV